MTRKPISTSKRVKIFESANGVCHLCGGKIQAGEAWDVSHEIPLAIGGADDDLNRLPAHRKCHRQHTVTVDTPRIAKTKRQYASHIGAKQPARNIQSAGFPKREPQKNRASSPINKPAAWRGNFGE